jgi:hypothetical protein
MVGRHGGCAIKTVADRAQRGGAVNEARDTAQEMGMER